MVVGYLPILRAPSAKSSSWYREFHNIYYLSQTSTLVLQSYVDSFITMFSESTIIEEKTEYLLKQRIVSISEEDGTTILTKHKEDEFKSIDVEDFLSQIIERRFNKGFDTYKVLLNTIGLQVKGPRKRVKIDITELLKTTNANNWYALLKGFLNIWEFLFLYGIVETTLKKILNLCGQTREEDLIKNIIAKHPAIESKLEKQLSVKRNAIDDLWKLFTEFRNIYSHSHGIMTRHAKSKLNGKLSQFRSSFEPNDIVAEALADVNKLFQNQSMPEGKFYLMKDDELNLFRNFVIALMETLDASSKGQG